MKSKFSFKKPKTWLIGAFIALLVILSCKKEFNTEDQPDRKQLSKLIQWYESNLKISDDNPFSKLEPNWDNLYIGNKDGKIVYEVELSNPDKLMVLGQKANRGNLSQELKKHSIKLLLFEGKKSHRILYASYMSIESHNFEDMGALHYKNLKNLTGVVFFYHFNGILGNGWEYKDGKIDHKLNPLTSEEYEMFKRQIENGKQQDGYQCAMTTVEKYKYGCVGVGNQMNCGYHFVGYETVMRCSYIDDTTLRNEGDEGPNPGENNGGGGYEAPLIYDCADVLDGSAYIDPSCKTCIGGTTGLTGCPNVLKEIKVDSTARPCVDTIATAVISKAMEIQNVLSNLLSLSNVNASAAISTMANSSTYRIKIGEHLFIDQTKYNSDGSSSLIRKNGVTNDTTGFIYLNKLMLNDGTDLAVAATLIHELMHSYMVYGIHHTTGTEREVFKTMNIFLFDQSGTPFSNQGVPQHIQMANTYVNSMASLLMSYATSRGILTSPDSSISLLEYCKDIFWQNLQHSQAYVAAPNKSRSASNGEREYKNAYNSTKKKRC